MLGRPLACVVVLRTFVWADIESWWGLVVGLHASSFAELGLERRSEARPFLGRQTEMRDKARIVLAAAW